MRGHFRSRRFGSIVAEAHQLAEEGVKELILVAQDSSRYGEDLGKQDALAHLLRELSHTEGIEWVRVMYTYPTHISDGFLDVLAEEPKAVKYLDMLLLIFIVSIVGIWAATRAEKTTQKKDPSIVVIDEVAGQMIALLLGPFWIHTWWSILSAFVLFRLFDIWKPYPIRRLEALESGLGIMADDILAGVYALIANSILISAYLLFVAHV